MKKRIIIISVLLLVFIGAIVGVGSFIVDIDIEESPGGDYQIVGLWIDKGGFGYGGAHYIKEKGLFSKWHKLGDNPLSAQWLSETEFSVYYSSPIDGNIHNWSEENYYKEYNVSEFFFE